MQHGIFKKLFFEIPLLILISSFTYLAINYLPNDFQDQGLLPAYVANIMRFSWIPITLFSIFFFFFLSGRMHIAKKYQFRATHNIGRRIIRYLIATIIATLIALPLSFIAVSGYALYQINSIIHTYNTDDNQDVFITDPQEIQSAILDARDLKITTISQTSYKRALITLALRDKTGFYEDRIIPSFPDILYDRIQLPQSDMVFVNNYLIINTATEKNLTTISPTLGRLLIQNYLHTRVEKALPDMQVLSRKDYNEYKNTHVDNQIDSIDQVMLTTDESIATISGYIDTNNQSIDTNQKNKDKAIQQQTALICKTPQACQNATDRLNTDIKIADDNIDKATLARSKNQDALDKAQATRDTIGKVIKTLDQTKKYTDQELGVFSPPNTIRLTIDPHTPGFFDIYLSTMIHEYYHYLSYPGDDRKLNVFFEEGLTEYFARQTVENYTGRSVDIGYPVTVRIIQAMRKRIPEQTFLDIYFSKNESELEHVLNATYGQNFFQQNLAAFNILNYLPLEQALPVANTIRKEIGATALTEKDFLNTY